MEITVRRKTYVAKSTSLKKMYKSEFSHENNYTLTKNEGVRKC